MHIPITVRKDAVTAVLQAVNSVNIKSLNVSRTVENGSVPTKLPKHLQSFFERSSENLDSSQRNRLEQFLIKHQDIFSKSSSDIGHTELIQHHIDVQNTKPVKKALYSIPLAKRRIAEQEIQQMAEDRIIEKCPKALGMPLLSW